MLQAKWENRNRIKKSKHFSFSHFIEKIDIRTYRHTYIYIYLAFSVNKFFVGFIHV